MNTINQHKHSFISAISNIIRSPFEHLLNIIVIAAIVAILSGTYLIGKNINNLEAGNISYPEIMVYLKQGSNASNAASIEASINKANLSIIAGFQYIPKNQGLAELQQDKDLKSIASDVLSEVGDNLPDVLIVKTRTTDKNVLKNLFTHITQLNAVDSVQMDENYASKIADLVGFVHKISGFLQILFTIVLALVIYSIIRLQMLLRQDEIVVSRLVGAPDSFIMRPLTYYALLQVIIGTGIAFYLVRIFVKFINELFLSLNNLFGDSFLFSNLNTIQMLQILGVIVVFSIFAVFLAVQLVLKNKYTQ